MPVFDAVVPGFSAGNALILAQLCEAAYLDRAPALAVTEQLGLTGFIWIDLTEHFQDVYAIAAGGAGFVVIAFRGTKDFNNWMTDLASLGSLIAGLTLATSTLDSATLSAMLGRRFRPPSTSSPGRPTQRRA
jgi:hypothetical protein